VCAGKTNESEPPMTCRKRKDAIKTGLQSLVRDELGGNLPTARAMAGMKALREPSAGSYVERGNLRLDAKGELQVVDP
jgi:hypothetical protein